MYWLKLWSGVPLVLVLIPIWTVALCIKRLRGK